MSTNEIPNCNGLSFFSKSSYVPRLARLAVGLVFATMSLSGESGHAVILKTDFGLGKFEAGKNRWHSLQKFNFLSANGRARLAVEIFDDQVLHFEFQSSRFKDIPSQPIYLTPYIDRENISREFHGTVDGHVSLENYRIETRALRVTVEPATLCLKIFDVLRATQLTQICPSRLEKDWKGLTVTREQTTDVYGLGEQFLPHRRGSADGNWLGEIRSPGETHGNFMPAFNGGFTGNAQFPILYALGPGNHNYAFFLDQVYKQVWDLRGDQWQIGMWGDQIRFFVIAGKNLPELRASYLKLVGRPLVPPKKSFGLWISEYGFDSWEELYEKLRTLRDKRFPVDGFVLDLQWFGGIGTADTTSMGKLRFDDVRFPEAAHLIRRLREQEGIGLMAIEESYIGRNLPEHKELEDRGFLARESPGSKKAFFVNNEVPWWGRGGMMDWTNPEAGRFWHDWKRQALISLGVLGHWTDLGEPEMYHDKDRPGARPQYHGFPELGKHEQADVHNVYSLLWHESIFDGYRRHQVKQRPWILSRSGGPGLQRYGAGMWSGDIGSNLSSLATHLNVQMHMAMSGVDYFGADIGGFHRGAIGRDEGLELNEMYTQWFANGSAFDVPVRPHTENVANQRETAPDRVGDLQSNLRNIRLRYELSPYYYSLAHRAYLFGEPIVPPLVYYYQDLTSDQGGDVVRKMGHEKMIGKDLLVAVVAKAGETNRDVYLPPGDWYDYRTQKLFTSRGEWFRHLPVRVGGELRLPLFARGGAILPKMFVDAQTLNIEGLRSDGLILSELRARIYPGQVGREYEFTVFEDDGRTNAYRDGEVVQTRITQRQSAGHWVVRVEPVRGFFGGAPTVRGSVFELAWKPEFGRPHDIRVNGESLPMMEEWSEFEKTRSAWFLDQASSILWIKSVSLPVSVEKVFDVFMDESKTK